MRTSSRHGLGWIAVCVALVFSATPLYAASDLFISEYVEGSGYNKAIELYNDTGASVDLSTYQLQYYFNGSATAGYTLVLSGSLPNGQTYVIAEDAAVPALRDLADQLDTATSWFNGDDAVVLVNSGVIIDAIGQIGVDPGSEWGSGDTSTQNNTLRRIGCVNDNDAYDAFDPQLQWLGYPQDNFDGIGIHSCDEPPPPSDTYIHLIQGSGSSSPLLGQTVTVEAIVVADFQASNELRGFFIQEEDLDNDSDPLSSEGVFVYDGGAGVDVIVGDLVRVTGTVAEYSGLTELTNVSVETVSSANPLPILSNVELPFSSADYLERFEGMRVRLPQTLSVTENYTLGRYGEVWLSSGGRLMQPTNIALPGSDALAQQAANDLNRLLIDDFSNIQNPDPIIYPQPKLTAFNTLRSGDTVAGVIGALHYTYGEYRVQPTQTPNFVASNARQDSPLAIGGQLRVASFNVLNYFNGDGLGGGFPTSRGADSLEEFNRQRDKIIAAINAMHADIIGLMEIENDGYGSDSAIADLVNGLNASAAIGVSYAYINPGVARIGTDEIAVGLIYRQQTVTPEGVANILDSSVDPRFDDTKNRPSLAQSFKELATGAILTIAVNHLKSKGSACDDVGDPDTGDGQGNCNLTRTAAAEALVDWLATDPTASGNNDALIIGDLNAYAKEDPVSAIKAAGYIDMIDSVIGAEFAYSYVFDGQSGYLDHALASPSLVSRVNGVAEWHINADEPVVLDYNTEYKSLNQITELYNADAFRASDHDPVIVGLDLPPVAQSMHVVDLDASIGRHEHRRFVEVTIAVQDDLRQAVAGAVVQGTWRGVRFSQSAQCSTDSEGVCSVVLNRHRSGNGLRLSFTVEALSHDTLIYDQTANSDADGDSDGTTINILDALRHTIKDWFEGFLEGDTSG